MFSRLRLPQNQLCHGFKKMVSFKNVQSNKDVLNRKPFSTELKFQDNVNIPLCYVNVGINISVKKELEKNINSEENHTGETNNIISGGPRSFISSEMYKIYNHKYYDRDLHTEVQPVYRLSYFRDPSDIERDSIDTCLGDFGDVMDPHHKTEVFTEVQAEDLRIQEEAALNQDTSGPNTWNLIM